MSVFDKLKVGADHVKFYEVEGVRYPIRNGTRSERNKIENSFQNEKTPMDSVVLFMFLRAANEDGSRYYGAVDMRDMAEDLDFDVAKKLLMAAQKTDEDKKDELPENMSLDEKTAVLAGK